MSPSMSSVTVSPARSLQSRPCYQFARGAASLLAVCWVIAVGCIMHALIDSIERILSLAGLLTIEYPAAVWASIDRRAADLQDLFFNEPWFLLEGLARMDCSWSRQQTPMVGRQRERG